MRTSRVYIDAVLAVGDEVSLERKQAHYLKNVLRLKPGAAFFLFNGRAAVDYRATLQLAGKDASARIESEHILATESALYSHVIQGLGRADHMDWMVQKTTELGVSRISIFAAARSQGKLRPKQVEKKLQHWHAIAISACEQCGRALLPQVEYFDALDSALPAVEQSCRLLLDFDGEPMASALPNSSADAALLLGPEGGLSEAEIALALEHGYQAVRLGPRVLRTETAATAALALLQSNLGDI